MDTVEARVMSGSQAEQRGQKMCLSLGGTSGSIVSHARGPARSRWELVMRRVLIATFSAALPIWFVPSDVSANGWTGRHGQSCCAAGPMLPAYPGNLPTYTTGGPGFFNPNLYYYRSYYPYPPFPYTRRASPRRRGRGIILEQ
jgi:hypothetical protein